MPVGFNKKTGREITSCVVLSMSEVELLKKEQERLGAPVNGTERRILMHLFTALDRHGRLVVHGEEPAAAVGKIVVPWGAVRDVWLETMPEEDDRKKATARIGKEFSRAKDYLLKNGIIGLDSPHIWWAGRPVRGFARTFPKKATDYEERRLPRDDDGHVETLDPGYAGSDEEVPL